MECSSVIKYLPQMHKTLGLIPSTILKNVCLKERSWDPSSDLSEQWERRIVEFVSS